MQFLSAQDCLKPAWVPSAESGASKQSVSSALLASHGGLRREVSDEEVSSFAKSVALPRYGPAKARALPHALAGTSPWPLHEVQQDPS